MVSDATVERVHKVGPRRLQTSWREFSETLEIGFARDERVQDRRPLGPTMSLMSLTFHRKRI